MNNATLKHIQSSYLCCHNLCISEDLLALLVCWTLQFVDRSRKLGHMQEFLFQGSENKVI